MSERMARGARLWPVAFPAFAAVAVVITVNAIHAQDERVGKIQQPLVSGDLVSLQAQRDFGLVTVGGGCSGTLVNRSWVLTADHCVTTNGQIKGPSAPLANLAISAAWTSRTATPTLSIRLWGDVALLFLGHGDIGAANVQLFYPDVVDTTQTITKFGRGIFGYATTDANGNPLPALADGLYRSGRFNPSSVDEDFITVMPNGSGQIANGGDSGGPDFVTAPNGTLLGIAAVQSTCVASGYVAGMPQNWTWATGVSSCNSVALAAQRSSILNIIANRTLASNDFNDDNLPDIVWHNSSTGETQIWFMDYSSRLGRATVVDEGGAAILIGLPWRIVASRDFNRDDRTDLLWYNEATGELQIWFMTGYQIASRATIFGENGHPTFIGPPWSVVGANDMNGDRYADIVWHNDSSGETQIWYMTGTRVTSRATVLAENGTPIFVGVPWNIVATDDMKGDRSGADLVWHNDVTGETQIWYMNGHRLTGRETVRWEGYSAPAALVGWPWRITGTNDFDGDRISDIVWHNASTGETQLWFMAVGAINRRATVDAARDGGGAFVGEPWRIMPH